jgi:rhodanese-related sulfurtransferase
MKKGLRDLVAEAKGRVREVDAAAAAAFLDATPGALVLDVREPAELAAGRLRGALNVPRGLLEPKAAADSPVRDAALADPARPVLVYCASGVRSLFAADVLQVLGFTDVRSLAGGFAAWQQAGRPIES